MADYDEGVITVTGAGASSLAVDSLALTLETLTVTGAGATSLSTDIPGEVKTMNAKAKCMLAVVT